jgi:hypothetical protein
MFILLPTIAGFLFVLLSDLEEGFWGGGGVPLNVRVSPNYMASQTRRLTLHSHYHTPVLVPVNDTRWCCTDMIEKQFG